MPDRDVVVPAFRDLRFDLAGAVDCVAVNCDELPPASVVDPQRGGFVVGRPQPQPPPLRSEADVDDGVEQCRADAMIRLECVQRGDLPVVAARRVGRDAHDVAVLFSHERRQLTQVVANSTAHHDRRAPPLGEQRGNAFAFVVSNRSNFRHQSTMSSAWPPCPNGECASPSRVSACLRSRSRLRSARWSNDCGTDEPGVIDAMAVAGSRRADTQPSCDAARATTSAIGVTIMELPKEITPDGSTPVAFAPITYTWLS